MEWNDLLSQERFKKFNFENQGTDYRSPYLVDVDRISFCLSFRKMQDKTQVYPLSDRVCVRTRLTHSLEVATVARSLGYTVGQEIVKKENLPQGITEHDFGYITQAAALAHDIGNPPFGHIVEYAIKDFFKKHKEKFLNLGISKENILDMENFDGNPQGFRIITKNASWRVENGLRLTYATLGAFMKYPTLAESKTKYPGGSKIGAFTSEKEVFLQTVEKLGLKELEKGCFARHPLAFITEAADDICYIVADIEDAYNMDILPLEQVEKLLAPLATGKEYSKQNEAIKEIYNNNMYKFLDDKRKIEWLRGRAIANMIVATTKSFNKNYPQIMQGEMMKDLLEATIHDETVKACKRISREMIFTFKPKIEMEMQGINSINKMLSTTFDIIENPQSRVYERLLKVLEIEFEQDDDNNSKFRKIMDKITGATDYEIMHYNNLLK